MGKAAAPELQNNLAVGCPGQKASSPELLSSTMVRLGISTWDLLRRGFSARRLLPASASIFLPLGPTPQTR